MKKCFTRPAAWHPRSASQHPRPVARSVLFGLSSSAIANSTRPSPTFSQRALDWSQRPQPTRRREQHEHVPPGADASAIVARVGESIVAGVERRARRPVDAGWLVENPDPCALQIYPIHLWTVCLCPRWRLLTVTRMQCLASAAKICHHANSIGALCALACRWSLPIAGTPTTHGGLAKRQISRRAPRNEVSDFSRSKAARLPRTATSTRNGAKTWCRLSAMTLTTGMVGAIRKTPTPTRLLYDDSANPGETMMSHLGPCADVCSPCHREYNIYTPSWGVSITPYHSVECKTDSFTKWMTM